MPEKCGCVSFWYRDVFFVVSRWPKSPFWYRDLFFGIEILYSVVQHLYRPLLGINLSVLFWASTSCKVEVKEDLDTEKKTEKSRYLKKDISIPTKRVTRKMHALNSRIWACKNGNLLRTLGRHWPGPCPHLLFAVFFEIDSY